MSLMNTTTCPTCSHVSHTYKFSVTKSLTLALKKMAASGAMEFNSKTLRDHDVISSSDFTNVTHLKYLGLVEKVFEDDGIRGEGRKWRITEKGVRYLNGERVNKWVEIRDKQLLKTSEETVTIEEADGYYQPPPYWAGVYAYYREDE